MRLQTASSSNVRSALPPSRCRARTVLQTPMDHPALTHPPAPLDVFPVQEEAVVQEPDGLDRLTPWPSAPWRAPSRHRADRLRSSTLPAGSRPRARRGSRRWSRDASSSGRQGDGRARPVDRGSSPSWVRELGAGHAELGMSVHPGSEPLDPTRVELGVGVQEQPVATAHVRPGEVGARREAQVLIRTDDPGVRQRARHGAGAAVGRGVVDRDELGEPAHDLRADRGEAAPELSLGVVQHDRHRNGRRRRARPSLAAGVRRRCRRRAPRRSARRAPADRRRATSLVRTRRPPGGGCGSRRSRSGLRGASPWIASRQRAWNSPSTTASTSSKM